MAIGSLISGVSALNSFEKGLEVIGNNVANVNTTGYKGSNIAYDDNFSQLLRDSTPSTATSSNTPAMQVGTGVALQSISTDFSQGTLTPTGSVTDLGIAGNGFFSVKDPLNGTNFVTRAGNFTVDDGGNLITQNGMRVQGLYDGGASYTATVVNGVLTYTMTATPPAAVGDLNVTFALGASNLTNSTGGAFTNAQVAANAPTMNSFAIDNSGNIIVTMSNGDSFTRGKVLLQNFNSPGSLVRQGNNLFSNMAAAGPVGGMTLSDANNSAGTNGLGKIESKALELSNVDLSSQFADLITTQRAFQAGSRIVTVTDSVLEEVVNLKRS